MLNRTVSQTAPPKRSVPAGDVIQVSVLGVPFRPLSEDSFLAWVDECVAQHRGAYVSAVNASSVVQSATDPAFAQALRDSDVNLPDGTPVAWAVSKLARFRQARLPGPAMMLLMLGRAQARGHRVLFYGSTDPVLELLQQRMKARFPDLTIVDAISPPFRPLSRSEDEQLCERIREGRPDIVFVGLGAPKQELWMRAHRNSIGAVLVGVGAAFDFHAGVIRRAPPWIQRLGLEWLFRLVQEPRRLWRRYATTLPVFVWRVSRQLVSQRVKRARGMP
jgi:N-acetylglucosaminyldiphosphoundecaprenol N-acetyl-beta-D-mannosaminyltransferase